MSVGEDRFNEPQKQQNTTTDPSAFTATAAQVKTIYAFKTDRVNVRDDF
jgi:hypothetical protein